VKKLLAIASSCALLFFVYVAVGLDEWSGTSRNVYFEFVLVVYGVGLGAIAYSVGKHKAFLIAPSIYVIFIVALPFLDLSPVKPALRAVHEIRTGMSEAQVRAILDRHFPEHGRFKRPEIGAVTNDAISFVLDRNDGRYNAAAVVIKFSEGRCVSARFFED
jgi:hypothetical protein